MKHADQIRARIETKGVKSTDIKHAGLLTDDEIANIPVENIYAWVRQGLWKQKDFNKWLKVMCVID